MKVSLLKYGIREFRVWKQYKELIDYDMVDDNKIVLGMMFLAHKYLRDYSGMENRKSYELIGNDLYHCWSIFNSDIKLIDVKVWIYRLQCYSNCGRNIMVEFMGDSQQRVTFSRHIADDLNKRLAKYERNQEFESEAIFNIEQYNTRVQIQPIRQNWLEYDGCEWSVKQ